ncbi:molecular chaperone Skp [Sporocytophaga myxococcoides]|uniref:Molecular chaperone Skp n=1 Tax=Sporocytophaga myxococcoides TaxID=153721 RepID=A0A098LE90_9BACT|nr:OmpH family outer membrane protein [Sporocytophaga myxococcoides]GAL84727.1 molecular chaperone Skp [Sporocytophaga myxococcoides]
MNNNLVKISLILNGLLIVAVAVLFYLHFKQPGEVSAAPEEKSEDTISVANIEMPKVPNARKIVFFNYDSLTAKYEFFKKIQREMETKARGIENELMRKEQKLQEDFEFYQKNAGAMTEQHRESKERELTAAQQELLALKENRSEQFAIQQQELNKQLMDKLYGYFNKLSRENNFDYILTYQKGLPGVVFGADSLDITKELVDGLNREYKKK